MKLSRSVLYASLALLLLVAAFALPIVTFHKVQDKIKAGDTANIPFYVAPIWNIYQTGRYISPYTPKGAEGDFKQMVERHGEVGVASIPVWFVSLEAPNYPKEAFPDGIPVYFHIDGYSGDVHEMNTINHFIGMYPMEQGAPMVRRLAPYIMVLEVVLILLFILVRNRITMLGMIVPICFPIGFLGIYAGWLYWYGHNLQEWGAFTVKPFMPTVFGDGKVAQFTTHSYPTLGFFILLAIAMLSLLAVFSRKKELSLK